MRCIVSDYGSVLGPNPEVARHGLILRHKPLPLKAFAEANLLSGAGLFEGWTFARSTRSKRDLDAFSPASRLEPAKNAAAIRTAMTRLNTRASA
jgi:hypothetical protein